MATALDIITGALVDIGVLSAGETASGDDASFGLTELNQYIDSLGAEAQTMYTRTRTTHAITANDGTYTIGSGGDIAIARPVFLDDVRFLDTSMDPDHEFPLEKLTEEAYAAIPEKARESTYPSSWYYNPTYATATLSLFPVPTSSTLTLALYARTAVTQFSALSTTVSLPNGYERMLRKNLAVELAPSYDKQPSPALVRAAMESLSTVKRANKRLSDLSFEAAALTGGGSYNIREN